MKKVLLFLLGIIFTTNVYANIEAVYDGFNVSEENHVRINPNNSVANAHITVTGTNANYIKYGKFTNNNGTYSVYYAGPLTFGTGLGDLMHKNNIDATITLKWSDGVYLYDGTTADLVMSISNIVFDATNNNGYSSSDGTYYITIIDGDDGVWFEAEKPTIALANKNWNSLTTNEQRSLTSGAILGNEYKVNIKVVKKGTNEVIDSKYSNMAFGAYDIDISDTTVDVSSITNETEKIKALYGGYYAEGIEFIDGVNSTIHMAKDTPIGTNKTEQAVVTYKNGPHNGIKIYGDGLKYNDSSIRPKGADSNTYYSGFITMLSPQGSDFYWTGRDCTTALLSSHDVVIDQKHNVGGTVKTTSYGKAVTLEQESHTVHAIGSSPIYEYRPNVGYHIETLKIDGTKVAPEENYRHTFEKIVYNPLVKLSQDGTPTTVNNKRVNLVDNHSIDVTYAPNKYIVVYENGGGTDGATKMPNQDGQYDKTLVVAKNEFAKKDYTFTNWLAYSETKDGVRTNMTNADGSPYIVKQQAALMNMLVPNDGKLVLVAQWQYNGIMIDYSSGEANDDPNKMESETLTGNNIVAKENKFTKDNATFVNWKVYLVDNDGNKTELLDDNNKQVYIADKGELRDIDLPEGTKVLLEAQWESNNSNPKTGIDSMTWISCLAVISMGGYYYLKRKNYFSKI